MTATLYLIRSTADHHIIDSTVSKRTLERLTWWRDPASFYIEERDA